ncbi:putative 5'-nucleotidase [Mycobacterium xenopi 4042]|uniref:Putative 5'-nucleotidase n=1 Tax=Mycobacterium xenopi 4042 TaxID=1299334 RepID=X8DAM7_MYCXE|nr:putative 5'-nucleotidase [Mycobacterium xenopi 4042]
MIFDLDGTLTDSAGGIVSSFCHALRQVGAPFPTATWPPGSSARPCITRWHRWGWANTPTPRSLPTAPTTAPADGSTAGFSPASSRCWPTCAPRACGWPWPPPRPSRPRDASWPTWGSPSISMLWPGQRRRVSQQQDRRAGLCPGPAAAVAQAGGHGRRPLA